MDPQQNSPFVPEPKPDSQPPAVNEGKPTIAYVGLILAFLLPLAGLIVSIIARRRILERSLPGSNLALAGIIVGGVFTAISAAFLGLMLWLFAALGGFHGNDAQGASKALTAQLAQIGGKKICSNGDSGYGIDNTKPWYEAYYEIPDTPGLTDKIKKIAASQGYQLRTNKQTIDQLQQDVEYSLPGDEQYNPSTDYLTGTSGDRDLTVQVNRDTAVSLACDSGQYGRKQAAGNGVVIVDISLSLPDTNR